MPFIKAEYGLLEEENFYLTSPAADFLGGGAWSRNPAAGEFTLRSGEIMRNLPYDTFVIDVELAGSQNGRFGFFLTDSGNASNKWGLEEESSDGSAVYWRITYYDSFIQCYASADGGITWENLGGARIGFGGVILQGFGVSAGTGLTLKNYKVYRSPYVKLQNQPPGFLARMTDADENVLNRYFTDEFTADFFFDRNKSCKLEIFDLDNNLASETDFIDFTIGDVFIFSDETIEIIYKDRALDHTVANLEKKMETLTIRNTGLEDVRDIHITAENENADTARFSFDGEEWEAVLAVDSLAPNEERDFIIRITGGLPEKRFAVKQFELIVY